MMQSEKNFMTASAAPSEPYKQVKPFLERSNSVNRRHPIIDRTKRQEFPRRHELTARGRKKMTTKLLLQQPSPPRRSSSLNQHDEESSRPILQRVPSRGSFIRKARSSNQRQPIRRTRSWSGPRPSRKQPRQQSTRSRQRRHKKKNYFPVLPKASDIWIECILMKRGKTTYFKSMDSQICLREPPIGATFIIYLQEFSEKDEEEAVVREILTSQPRNRSEKVVHHSKANKRKRGKHIRKKLKSLLKMVKPKTFATFR